MKLSQREIYRYGETILGSCSNLKAHIFSKDVVPYQVEIHPPPKGEKLCWLNCNWCYGKYHKFDPSLRIRGEGLVEIVKEICERGKYTEQTVRKLIFSGVATDPLNSDSALIEDLIKIVKKNKMIYGIHTKLLIIQDTLIDVMVDGGREGEDYISISLDAGNSEIYNRVHNIRRGNIFERVLDNIRRIIKKGQRGLPKVVVTYLLDQNNSDEDVITEAIERCRNIGVEYIRFSIPQLQFCNEEDRDYKLISMEKIEHAKEIVLRKQKEEISPLEILFIDFPLESLEPIFKKRVLPCYARWIFPTIGFDGFLYPCCQVATGEFKELRIADLQKIDFWESFYAYEYPKDRIFNVKSSCKCDRKALDVNKKLKGSGIEMGDI